MEKLSEYIKESLLDDEDTLVNNTDIESEQWVKDNYTVYKIGRNGTKDFNIINGILNAPDTGFAAKVYLTELTNGKFNFGKVGEFECASCTKLKSLKGGPTYVRSHFDADYCINLKSLEGAPEHVGAEFDCSWCKIKDLNGAPEYIGSDFIFRDCKNLKSTDGFPKEIKGHIIYDGCSSLPLSELKKRLVKESLLDDEEELVNNDEVVIKQWLENNYVIYGKKDFTIKNGILNAPSTSFKLKNIYLEHLTNGLFKFGEVIGFDLQNCRNLKDLSDGPTKTKNFFYCINCDQLKNLKGAPNYVGTTFDCSHCKKLESLEGAPNYVGGDFYSNYCPKLKSLKGLPKEIGYDFEYYCTPAAEEDSNKKYIKQSQISGDIIKEQ